MCVEGREWGGGEGVERGMKCGGRCEDGERGGPWQGRIAGMEGVVGSG